MNLKYVVGILTVSIVSIASFGQFWRGKTLNAAEVAKKWGTVPYKAEVFRQGSQKVKSSMASSILLEKKLIGLDVDEIRSQFGQPDGFYFIDSYPSYIIQEGKDRSEETWQIVFLLNEKYKVRDIIVHKNCCD